MFNLILIRVARGTAVKPVEDSNLATGRISFVDFRKTVSEAEMGEGGADVVHSMS